jgi:hypothetical protein
VDKATKLESIFDRVHLIDTRFEVLKRDAEIELLKNSAALQQQGLDELSLREHSNRLEQAYKACLRQYDQDREFLRKCNIGGEFMPPEAQEHVRKIAGYKWLDQSGNTAHFLSDDEIENLSIPRGTLTGKEREIINYHIVATIKMLEALPWPKHLRHVPEYAGGHHERMDGKGYPRGLMREQMSVQARVMGIADIFEALTARDRPYKKGKTLTESLQILGKFKENGHIDPDLFDVFIRRKVYQRYAEQFLDANQIDRVDENKIPGYSP